MIELLSAKHGILMQKEMLIVFAMISITTLFASSAEEILASEEPGIIKIITDGDLYVQSKVPTQVPFDVTATDHSNNEIPVQCDKISNSTFKVGKTTVRCMATDDDSGNEARNSFVVTVGYDIVQIPEWFKQTTEFWTSQNMSDDEYIHTLGFLLHEQIIHVPLTKSPRDNSGFDIIPIWINTNAEKWTKGEISNDEFSIGIQWMLNHGMIRT